MEQKKGRLVKCVLIPFQYPLLSHAFIFQEKNKILFYYPYELEIDSKIKDVGLCEAIIKFTK